MPKHSKWHHNQIDKDMISIVWCCDIELPGIFVSFGIRHLTKWGWVLFGFAINFPRFSCNEFVLNIFVIERTVFIVSALICVYEYSGTLKTADTVCKDEPLFFVDFLTAIPDSSSWRWISKLVSLVFSINLVLPAVLSVLWSHICSQPSLVGNTGLSAG